MSPSIKSKLFILFSLCLLSTGLLPAQNLGFDGSVQGAGHVQIAAEAVSVYSSGVAGMASAVSSAVPAYALRVGLNSNVDLLVVGAGSSFVDPSLHNTNFGVGFDLDLLKIGKFSLGDQLYAMKPATQIAQGTAVLTDSFIASQGLGWFRPYFGVSFSTSGKTDLDSPASVLYGITIKPFKHLGASLESTAGQTKSVGISLKLYF